jgi:hypothetical protein
MYQIIMPAPKIPIGTAQYAPLIPPIIAPAAPMIAQIGDNAPGASLSGNTIHPSGFFV